MKGVASCEIARICAFKFLEIYFLKFEKKLLTFVKS